MTAAENGHKAAVAALLEAGAPWNQQDKEGYCAGEYASASKNQAIVELIMEWGVQAELMLMAAERWAPGGCLRMCICSVCVWGGACNSRVLACPAASVCSGGDAGINICESD